jgi:hypothetical protein
MLNIPPLSFQVLECADNMSWKVIYSICLRFYSLTPVNFSCCISFCSRSFLFSLISCRTIAYETTPPCPQEKRYRRPTDHVESNFHSYPFGFGGFSSEFGSLSDSTNDNISPKHNNVKERSELCSTNHPNSIAATRTAGLNGNGIAIFFFHRRSSRTKVLFSSFSQSFVASKRFFPRDSII